MKRRDALKPSGQDGFRLTCSIFSQWKEDFIMAMLNSDQITHLVNV